MNIFHKVALQGLRKNRTRTFVTVVGVALSAALFTTIATFGTSLLAYLIQGSVAKCGNWHIDFVDVDTGFVEERQKDPEVTDAAALENMGYALLDGAESAEKPYLFLAGFTDETFSRLPVTLISGRLPQHDGEILIPNHVSIKAGVRIPVGEVLELDVGSRESRRREGQEESCESGRQEGQGSSYESASRPLNQHDPYQEGEILVPVETKQYLVVGTYERAEFEEHDSPGYTVITRAEGIHGSGRYSLFLTLNDPKRVKAYEEKFEGTVPFVLNEDVLRFYGVSDNRLFNAIVLAAGGTLTAIIMIGSVFLIYNAFHISLSERMHQFGILMSVGATKKQLRNSVLFEGLCIGAMGIPFGMAAGIGGVALILPLVEKNFAVISASRVPLKLAVSVPALAAAAAVSLVTILISAYIPARKAAAIPVMDCIRQTGEVRLETKKVRTSILAGRIYGLEGVLALKNFRRNKRRYRSVILSLTLSVVLFVSGTAFGSTLKGIAKVLTVEADGDISFYAEAVAEEELLWLYDKLKTVEGVRESTWQTNALYSGVAEGLPEQFFSGQETGELPEHFWGSQETGELPEQFSGGQGQAADGTADRETNRETARIPVHAQFIEDSIYEKFIETMGFSKEEYSGPDGNVLSLFVDTSEHETFLVGQPMEFTLYSSDGNGKMQIRTTVVDTYPLDMLPFDSTPHYLTLLVIPWSRKGDFNGFEEMDRSGMTFWTDTPAQTMAGIQAELTDRGITWDYTLINLSTAVDLFRSLTFVVDLFTYVFVTMVSLIAVANVFNTISTNIRLRHRELAMLRSMGMSESGFNRMMCFECFFYGLRTLLAAVPLAGILSWLIHKGMAASEQLEGFAYHFPWKSMTVSVLGVFGIVFITMLYAAGKIRKENIIDALRDDMA